MVLSLKVSVLVALVESPSNIARIFQAQQLSCCGFMHEKYPTSRVESLIARFQISDFWMQPFGLLFGIAIVLVFSTTKFCWSD